MSVIITPIITNAGLGVFTPMATGIEFTFTHVAVGTGTSAASPTDTALENEIARFPIAGGGVVTGGQAVSINALITNHGNANPQDYDITEFGFYGLDGSNNTVLFAIYRTNTTIVSKVSGADISAPFVMGLAALPTNNITVQIDTNASAMLALLGQHTAANHPHTQYKRTLDNSERLKAADGVDNDDVVTKGQLKSSIAAADFGVFSNEQTFNTVGAFNFVVPQNVSRVVVELQAAGGGGGLGGGNDGGAEVGAAGGGGASGQWISVLIFNLVENDELNITIGSKGLGGTLSVSATDASDTFVNVDGRDNSTVIAKGGRKGQQGGAGDNNGSDAPYRGAGGLVWNVSSVNMRFCTRVSDVFEASGIGGGQTGAPCAGGNSLFGIGGSQGADYPTVGNGENGTLGAGGGGGAGGTGSAGGNGGDGGDGYVKVYW